MDIPKMPQSCIRNGRKINLKMPVHRQVNCNALHSEEKNTFSLAIAILNHKESDPDQLTWALQVESILKPLILPGILGASLTPSRSD